MDLNKYRHKWENRMVIVAILVGIAGIFAAVLFVLNRSSIPDWVQAVVVVIFVTPIITAVMIRYNYWKEVVDSIEVTEKQYPELYRIFLEQVEKAELGFVPRLYLKNGNGKLNAFASKNQLDITKGAYVLVYSDMVDTFYDLKNEDTIRFVLSHELGHIKLGHVHVRRSVLRGILTPFFLNDTFTRAQEYSADRFAASITNKIATPALAVLVGGKRNYEQMDVEQYAQNDARHISKFWVAVVNFRANHAVGRRRLAAAYQMDKEGWDVHGNML